MENLILIAATSVTYLLFAFKCFTLIEGMLNGRHFGFLFRLFIGVLNAAVMLVMALNISITIAFLISIVVLYAEVLIIFKKSLKDTLFISVAVMINIMCLRGMVVSLFALSIHGTLFAVCSNSHLFLGVLLVSNLLEWLALFAIMHFMKMEDLQVTIHNKTQSRFIIIWASLCFLFMLRIYEVYFLDYGYPNMFIEHFIYCFMLLLSFYYLLIYTFKINRSAKIRELNKKLHKDLGNQMELQSALMRDAFITTQANLTQNLIISGIDKYPEFGRSTDISYDAWFEYMRTVINSDDYNIFCKSIKRQNMIDNFNLGIEPKPFEYRRLGNDNKYHWVRLVVRMFKDVESDDVHVFGYAFDIENEVRDRQALLRGAQIDLFTGLYNKATTQTIISEEIRKGAGLLILLDIDNFKTINDKFGHEAGDYILKYIADMLTDTFRQCDVVGRVGGDEFMIYIKDAADISIAEARASDLLSQLKIGVEYKKKQLFVTASIGIAVVDEKIDNFSLAYNQADSALYLAKHNGKNGYTIYGIHSTCSAC